MTSQQRRQSKASGEAAKAQSTSRNRNKKSDKEEASAPPQTPENGVVVWRVEEGGQVKPLVQPIGDVRVTEIQTLLRMGLNAHEEQNNLR